MKIFLYLFILVCILSLPQFASGTGDTDPGISIPVNAAKEYMAEKYECNINDLTVGEALIGRRTAHIDINYGYTTERVFLRYNDAEQKWEAEGSEPLHRY